MSLENRVPSTNTKCGQIRIVSRLVHVPSCRHLTFPVLLLNQPTMWHLVMPIQSSRSFIMQLQLTCMQLLLPTDIKWSSEGVLEEYSMFHHMGCQIFDSPFTVLHLVWKYVFPHFLDYIWCWDVLVVLPWSLQNWHGLSTWKTVTVIIIIVVFCFVVVTNLQGMIYHIPLSFFYLHTGFKPWIWRWRRNGITGWNSKSLALWQYVSIQNHWDILNFAVHIWKMFCLLKILILLLTTALSRVEGGCLGCWGASTVISQLLDSKRLPCLAIPGPLSHDPPQRDIQAPITLW